MTAPVQAGGGEGVFDRPTVAGTDPYPWPYDGLDPGHLVLVIAGADEEWRSRVSEIAVGEVDLAVEALVIALAERDVPTVPIVHGVGATLGNLNAGDSVSSAGIDGFYGSDLDHRLRRTGRHQVLVAGYGLEAPVHSTMRSANDMGYECLLLTDCSAPLDDGTVDAAHSSVTMSGGIFGAIGTGAAVLEALDLIDRPATEL